MSIEIPSDTLMRMIEQKIVAQTERITELEAALEKARWEWQDLNTLARFLRDSLTCTERMTLLSLLKEVERFQD